MDPGGTEQGSTSAADDASSKNSSTRDHSQPQATHSESPKRPLSWWTWRRLQKTLATCGMDKPRWAEARREAIRDVVQAGDPRAIPALIKALEDEWVIVREAAAQGVAQLRVTAAVPTLLELLARDDSADVRRAAGLALAALGAVQATERLLTLGREQPAQRLWISDAIARLGSGTLGTLIKLLEHADSGYRMDAVIALGRLKLGAAVKPLLACLQDEDSQVRMHAAEALGQLGDRRAVAALVQALTDPAEPVRAKAAAALGLFADPRTLTPLLKAVPDDACDVRAQVAFALGALNEARAVPALLRLARDEHHDVRLRAVEALAPWHEERVVEGLGQALSDSHTPIRLKAASALGKTESSLAVDFLLTALRDTSSAVRARVVEALGTLGDPLALDGLADLWSTETNTEVKLALVKSLGQIGHTRGLETLAEALSDELTVRCRACVALGELGDSAGVDLLLPVLRDPAPEVRYQAAVALGMIGDARAVKPLEELLAETDSFVLRGVAKGLKALGDPRGEQLLTAIRDGQHDAVVSPATQGSRTKPATASPHQRGATHPSNAPHAALLISAQKRLAGADPRRGTAFLSRLVPDALAGLFSFRGLDLAGDRQVWLRVGVSTAALLVIAMGLWWGIDSATGSSGGAPSLFLRGGAVATQYHPAGDLLLVTRSGHLERWDVASARRTSVLNHFPQGVTLLACSPDGNRLAVALAREPHLLLVDVTRNATPVPVAGLSAAPHALDFGTEGATLYTASRDGSYCVIDAATGQVQTRGQLSRPVWQSLCVLGAKGWVAGGTKDGFLSIFDVSLKREIFSQPGHPQLGVSGVSLSRDGKQLASAGMNHVIHLWDVTSQRQLKTVGKPSGQARTDIRIGFTPQPRMLFVHSAAGGFGLMDLQDGKTHGLPGTEMNTVHCFACSPDGRQLVGGHPDEFTTFAWDLTTRKPLAQLLP